MKRIFLILLSALIFLGSQSTWAQEIAEETISVSNELEELIALDMYSEQQFAGDFISRAEYVAAVIKFMGLTNIGSAEHVETIFRDVSVKEEYAAAIDAAYTLGFISASGSRLFEPNAEITYGQAIKILICALGYQFTAENQGGFPEGYMISAANLKLLKGLRLDLSESIKQEHMILLFYNALTVPIMTKVSYADTEHKFETKKDRTLLSEKDIYFDTGIINGNSKIRLTDGGKLAQNNIMIDSVIYETDSESYNELLGQFVKYYYYSEGNMQDDRKILHISVLEEKNNILKLDCDVIMKGSKSQYEYEEDDKIKKARISNSADILYNGKLAAMINEERFVPKYGSVKLLDNNGDDIFDVVMIDDYDLFIVDSKVGNTFYDKYDKTKTIELDPNDNTKEINVTDMGGFPADLLSVTEWTVLYVYESNEKGKKVYDIMISSSVESGEISEVIPMEDGDAKKIKMNVDDRGFYSKEYITSDVIPENILDEIRTGISINFILGIDGKIIAIKDIIGKFTFGYLISAYTGFSETQVKLFSEDGEMKILDCAPKLTIDGIRYSKEQAINHLLTLQNAFNEVVRYRLNFNNEITEIDTIIQTQEEGIDSLRKKSYSGEGQCHPARGTFGGKLSYKQNITVMLIPVDGNDEDFKVMGSNKLVSAKQYSGVVGYFSKANDLRADLLLMKNEGGGGDSTAGNVSYISKITKAVDSDSNESYKLFLKGQNYVEYEFVVDGDFKYKELNLDIGDGIRYTLNSKNEISDITKVFDYSEAAAYYNGQKFDAGLRGSYTGEFGVIFGNILKKSNGVIYLDSVDLDFCFESNLQNAVYKLDYDYKGQPYVKNSSYFELVSQFDHPQHESKIFIQMTWGSLASIFIVEGLEVKK